MAATLFQLTKSSMLVLLTSKMGMISIEKHVINRMMCLQILCNTKWGEFKTQPLTHGNLHKYLSEVDETL